MRLLNLPVPLFGAAASFQLPEGMIESTPGWLIGASVLVYVTIYAVNQFPSRKNRRTHSFSDEDRDRLEKVTNLLAWRDDRGRERFLKMEDHAIETNERLERSEALMEQMAGHLKVLAADAQRRA